MPNSHKQRGSLLIVTVVMIVILSFLGIAITFLSVTNSHNAMDDFAAQEAFVLAESGLQRGIKQWSLAPATYAGEGPVNFGNGSFTVAAPVLISATEAQITSTATVPSIAGNVSRTVEAVVQLGAPLASNLFADLATWPTQVLTGNQGDASLVGGGIRFRTNNTNGATYAGYRETGTAPPALTLNAGETINLDLDYKKRILGGGADPTSMDMAVALVSTTGTPYVIWSETTIFNNNGWLTAPTTTWTVPVGVTIDRIRLIFNVRRSGGGKRPEVHFSNVVITSASGASTNIVSWQEVIP